jgi:hypothetical protein
MEPVAFVLIAAVLGLSVVGAGLSSQKKRHEAWGRLAGQLGLTLTTGRFLTLTGRDMDRVTGELEGLQVSVYLFHDSAGENSNVRTGFKVSGGGLPRSLTLKREGAGAAIGKLFKGEDIQIGDPSFDRTALVRGDTFTARAALNERARKQLAGFLSEGGRLEDGELQFDVSGSLNDAQVAAQRLRQMVALAGVITAEGTGERALARNAVMDPLPAVRASCLEALLRTGRMDELRTATARRCLTDPSAEVATIAALALGAEGLPRLQRLVDEPGVPHMLRLEALKALGVQSEERVLALLEAPDLAVKVAAVRALYEVGTLGAVEHLLPLTQGLLTDGDLKREARNAVDAIQARHGGERGAFTLADATPEGEGALSLTGDAGALSLSAKARARGEGQADDR